MTGSERPRLSCGGGVSDEGYSALDPTGRSYVCHPPEEQWLGIAGQSGQEVRDGYAVRPEQGSQLVLEAARRPEIHRALAAGTELMLERLAALFPSSPPEEARLRARDVLAFIDGLLLANVTSPEQQRHSPADMADALTRVIDPWTAVTN